MDSKYVTGHYVLLIENIVTIWHLLLNLSIRVICNRILKKRKKKTLRKNHPNDKRSHYAITIWTFFLAADDRIINDKTLNFIALVF